MTPYAIRCAARLDAMCRSDLRAPVAMSWDGTEYQPEFSPPLSAEEGALLEELRVIARSPLQIDPSDFGAIKSDLVGVKAYLGVTSPTAAQTAAATKAIIRVLGTIIRS